MMLPNFAPLSVWADSLFIDFPNDNIPRLENEDDWKRWGNFLVQENSFVNNGAPGTQLYSEWKTWAEAVFKVMASN